MPYTVFPLHGIRADGTCACPAGAACTSKPGKHPAVLTSQLQPGEQVFGPAGHGIATGARSGIFVVDTDTPEADARFRAACAVEGYDPDSTHVVKTPKAPDTRHYYFVAPGFPVRNSRGELLRADGDDLKAGSMIDVRGDGGMVVMAGSPHANGGVYVVERNNPPRRAPAFVLSWPGLQGRERVEGENAPKPVDEDVRVSPPAWLDGASSEHDGKTLLEMRTSMGRDACLEMPAALEGSNGSLALWNVCLRLVRELELPLAECFELVSEVYNPRCDPPWSPKEIEHKIIDARDKSTREPGDATPIDPDALGRPAPQAPDASGHVYECTLDSVTSIAPAKTTIRNVCNILAKHPSWEGVFAYDAFRERIVCKRRPPIRLVNAEKGNLDESDITRVRVWFETIGGYVVSKDVAWDAVVTTAQEHTFHPLHDYLNGLKTSPGGAIDGLCDAFGLDDPFERLYVRRFVIGAVRRAYSPGCKLDNMLVLFGPPGLKKSTSVLALFGEEWVSQNLADIADEKKVGEVLAGKWAVELAELKDVLAAGNETVAAFITRTSERFRAAYARGNAIDRPRTSVLIASTNESDVLRNSTGADARRFWIVKPRGPLDGKIDIDWIRANRDAVWFEAVALARAGEKHWLDGEEEREHLIRMKAHEERDGWHEDITTYCMGRAHVRSEDVWKYLGGTLEKYDGRSKRRIEDTLRRLGCVRKLVGKMRVRVWAVPEDVRTAELPPEEAAKRASADVAKKLAQN